MRSYWTPGEALYLRMIYADTPTSVLARLFGRSARSVYQKAKSLGLRKSASYMERCLAECGREVAAAGAASRFRPGLVPWNTGRKGYDSGGRSHETRFRKGQMAGAAQRKWVPVGTEVVDPDGYLKRKIADDPSQPSRFNWACVHVLLWEEHNGPAPPGHAVVFRNGRKDDIRIENLELITRAELMARNSIHNYPPDLRQAIRLAGKLRRVISKRERAA